jgi:glycosyltransferase involved in cell wall biosynthesis
MRVGCNLLWLVPGRVGGTEMATVALLREISAHGPDDVELTLYALEAFGEMYPDVVAAFPSRLAPLTGQFRPLRVAFENTWLARQSHGEVDIVHHMGGVLPVLRGAPGVVTLHDLQPFDMPENFQPAKRAYLQRLIPRSVRDAVAVIAPTDFVRQGILERFDVAPDRVLIAPWGVDPTRTNVSVAQVQARYGLPRRWFVFPSFTWNHKNHPLLLRAFAAVAAREHDIMLVLTGGQGPAEQTVVEEIERLGLRGRVRRTGLIPRRDVLAIVRGAVAMVFPSTYEGFGLPVLEGMSLGTPVLASDAAALPEVVGAGGRLVPVHDADAWVDAMTLMLHDGEERQRLTEAGHARVAEFTWQRTARDTIAAYRAGYAPSSGSSVASPSSGSSAGERSAASSAAPQSPAPSSPPPDTGATQ